MAFEKKKLSYERKEQTTAIDSYYLLSYNQKFYTNTAFINPKAVFFYAHTQTKHEHKVF